MAQAAGGFGDLPSLGELLALLHRADAAFDRVEASYRIWRHEQRSAAARQAQVEEEKRRGASISSFGFSDDSERPVEVEEVLRVWRAEGRFREEHAGGSRDGAYLVRDGDAWWTWDERNGAHSNEGNLTSGYSDGGQISLILNPTPLLGSLRFTPTGRGRLVGRETVTADAVPRRSDRRDGRRVFELYALGGGADRYALQVDAERGVLLEAVAFRDGEPFQRITTEQVVFNHAIDPERFRFAAPAGEEIRSPLTSRVQQVSLAEAQLLAPFIVLVPERIPTEWFGSYSFIEPSKRPPSAACVSIHFRSDDGHESVSLSQHAVGDQPDQYNLMLKRDDWQTITRNGTDVQVRAIGSQTQAHVERDETFVFLSSETLTAEQLTTIAAGLKPAPASSSI
jgi:hypothetical protein